MESPEQANPLASVTPVRKSEWNKYPDIVRIPMDDGTVQDYEIIVRQPHPAFQKVINLLDSMPVYGGYKAPPPLTEGDG